MTGPGHDASFRLPDGRALEYWDGGDPGGRAVIFQPGTPMTRVLGRWGHDARHLGLDEFAVFGSSGGGPFAPTLLLYGTVDAHCRADRDGQWLADRTTGSQPREAVAR